MCWLWPLIVIHPDDTAPYKIDSGDAVKGYNALSSGSPGGGFSIWPPAIDYYWA